MRNLAAGSTYCCLGNSTEQATVDKVRQHGPYDLVFIDGDHSPAGVRALAELRAYGAAGGIHDIDAEHGKLTPARLADYGVHQLWTELKERYGTRS